MAKSYPVCKTCGSQHVMKDAWADWDHERQMWVLQSWFDATHCDKCEGWTNIEWIEGDPKDEEDEDAEA